MKLRAGISGFRHSGDPELPMCDLKRFFSCCREAAHELGGRVLRTGHESEGVAASFAKVTLEIPAGELAVLLNRHFPVVGFAAPLADGEAAPFQFKDCEELADVFRKSGEYDVATQDDLERSFHESDWSQLLPAEIAQVRYWRPRRIGDVVFNFWD